MRSLFSVVGFSTIVLCATVVHAGTITVDPGSSIQAAITSAQDGDTISVAAGSYHEDIDFAGKAVAVVGAGPSSIIQGSGNGSVVRFASGESATSVLDSVTVTGGLADRGGGIYILNSSPMVRRTVVRDNTARRQGSGIYIEGTAVPQLYNNLIAGNRTESLAAGETHSIEVQNANPIIVNNTVTRGDGNGLILRGGPGTIVMNNIFAANGSRVGGIRGRGICDFSGGALIQYNLFYRNTRAALLTSGRDYQRVRRAERQLNVARLAHNADGPPRFSDSSADDFTLRPNGRAFNAGNPDPAFTNRDGSRNHIGFTGGPFAP